MHNWRFSGLRYNKYAQYLQERFGRRVYKTCIDAGFECPNINGDISKRGCIYCDQKSFTPTDKMRHMDVSSQIDRQIRWVKWRYKTEDAGYLAYFQASTSTYDSPGNLKRLYDEAVSHPSVIGLVVGTRPDCVDDSILDLLESYAQNIYVCIEYGLQSSKNESLKWIGRGHDVDCFLGAVEKTKGRGIEIGAHVILGLPCESLSDMLDTARYLGDVGVDSVKIHNLHITRGTALEALYLKGEVPVYDVDEYVSVLVDFLEELSPSIVIQRMIGDAPGKYLVAPSWVADKQLFLRRLFAVMEERDSYQGIRWHKRKL
ncbi:MAG: TIGR01212 family radical SAM protein [Oligoflexales bacterium]|nr:TIGR01212 family radical SAM protein [Oligoflexales bacterium]